MVDGWKVRRVADLAKLESGHTPDRKVAEYWGGDIPWVSLQDVDQLKSKKICQTKETITSLGIENSSARLLPKNTVVFSRTASVGLCSLLATPMATSQDFVNFICGQELMPEFLVQVMRGMKREWHRLQAGSTHKTIYYPEFEKIEILVPPIREQLKIVEILRTWDEAIEKWEALRIAKARRLDGLRVTLLFGVLLVRGRKGNWAQRRLGEVTHELIARNNGNPLGRVAVMGVTKAKGVVPMREQTIAGDISRYKRLPPRAFAYNPMRINVGSIAMNARKEEVLVSPDYVVFACDDDRLDPDYLDHLRKTPWWEHYISSGASGSVRMRTYYDDLAALKLPLPDLDEQRDIARILNTARDDLVLTEREIDALKRQKRGMMQMLLTGECRVSADARPAE